MNEAIFDLDDVAYQLSQLALALNIIENLGYLNDEHELMLDDTAGYIRALMKFVVQNSELRI